MPTLVCVPVFVESLGHPAETDPIDAALADAALAKQKGADLVEFRIDRYFNAPTSHGGTGVPPVSAESPPSLPSSPYQDHTFITAQLHRLLAESPLPVILTCRPTWEGGDYDGDDAHRVALFEKLCCESEAPPAYLDVELAAYTRSANLRQKINLCVSHPDQKRRVSTRLILSIHDFQTRPPDLQRKLLAAYDEPACSVVKVAFRARSLRDNLDLFEILRNAPKPTIALGMGQFGLMSRVLAPKFNAFLTFASLREQAATAPGQPTIDDLLGLYRFRSIDPDTNLLGVIGWPVTQSLGPLIHNAGFNTINHNAVYLPLPIAADEKDPATSAASFKATLHAFLDDKHLDFAGASVTIPHKESAARLGREPGAEPGDLCGAANTIAVTSPGRIRTANTDARAILELLADRIDLSTARISVVGAGGVARAAAAVLAQHGATIDLFNRTLSRAESLAAELTDCLSRDLPIHPRPLRALPDSSCNAYINCTPVGMVGRPDDTPPATALSIPVHEMNHIDRNTIFFDTVYNPIETPMLKAARERGCRTIDGVQMFVKQAAAQFELWTQQPAPAELFDSLCRDALSPPKGKTPR